MNHIFLTATDTMTGARVCRLQELAADFGESSCTWRATKEANRPGRQNAIES